jgi:hypothetical protein
MTSGARLIVLWRRLLASVLKTLCSLPALIDLDSAAVGRRLCSRQSMGMSPTNK